MTAEPGFDWPDLLHRLARRQDLSEAEAARAMTEVMEGTASPVHIAAFLVALRTKTETAAEMCGLVQTMLAYATPIPVKGPLIDTCGTGGDRAGTINVSTLAALVVAGAGGRVAKHGNRAASSRCGSADLLEALGVNIEAGPDAVARCIDEAGVGFCFAARYHPAMRFAAPVRRELGIPTIMNFLGPLSNPARATHQVVGVSDPAMAAKMIEVLERLGKERALVVFGHDGLDEITTTTTSTVFELRAGEVRTWALDPRSLGIDVPTPGDLHGGDVARNTEVARDLLAGWKGPARDIVCLNAAAALYVAGLAADLPAGFEMAGASLGEGKAAAALEAMVAASQEPAAG